MSMAQFEALLEELLDKFYSNQVECGMKDELLLITNALLKLHKDTNLRLDALGSTVARIERRFVYNQNHDTDETNNLVSSNSAITKSVITTSEIMREPIQNGQNLTITLPDRPDDNIQYNTKIPQENPPRKTAIEYGSAALPAIEYANAHFANDNSCQSTEEMYNNVSPEPCVSETQGQSERGTVTDSWERSNCGRRVRSRCVLARHDTPRRKTRSQLTMMEEKQAKVKDSRSSQTAEDWVEHIPTTITKMNLGPGEKLLDIVIDVDGESLYLGTIPVQNGALSRKRIKRAIEGLGIEPKDIIDVSIQESGGKGKEGGVNIHSRICEVSTKESVGNEDRTSTIEHEAFGGLGINPGLNQIPSPISRTTSISRHSSTRRGRRRMSGRPPGRPSMRYAGQSPNAADDENCHPQQSPSGCKSCSVSLGRLCSCESRRGNRRGRGRGRGRRRGNGRRRGGRKSCSPRGCFSGREEASHECVDDSSASLSPKQVRQGATNSTDILTESLLHSGIMTPSFFQSHNISYSQQVSPVRDINKDALGGPSCSIDMMNSDDTSKLIGRDETNRTCAFDIMAEIERALKTPEQIVFENRNITEINIPEKANSDQIETPAVVGESSCVNDRPSSNGNTPCNNASTADSVEVVSPPRERIDHPIRLNMSPKELDHEDRTTSICVPSVSKTSSPIMPEEPRQHSFSTPVHKIGTPITRPNVSHVRVVRRPVYSGFVTDLNTDSNEKEATKNPSAEAFSDSTPNNQFEAIESIETAHLQQKQPVAENCSNSVANEQRVSTQDSEGRSPRTTVSCPRGKADHSGEDEVSATRESLQLRKDSSVLHTKGDGGLDQLETLEMGDAMTCGINSKRRRGAIKPKKKGPKKKDDHRRKVTITHVSPPPSVKLNAMHCGPEISSSSRLGDEHSGLSPDSCNRVGVNVDDSGSMISNRNANLEEPSHSEEPINTDMNTRRKANVIKMKRKWNSNEKKDVPKRKKTDARVSLSNAEPILTLIERVSAFIYGDLQSFQVTDFSSVPNHKIKQLCDLCGLTYVSFGAIGIMKKTPSAKVPDANGIEQILGS